MKLIGKPRIETWRVDDLKPYPLQSDFFRNVSKMALRALAEDIKANGLKEPIEILPDGTIISGHMRRLAIIMFLFWAEVEVRVRYDLAARGPEATECEFLRANLNRRNLHPLEIARSYQRLKELERSERKRRGEREEDYRGDWRDQLARQFGYKSHRQLDRLVTLLRLPVAAQRAYQSERINQSQAMRLLNATPELQDQATALASEGKLDGKALKVLLGRERKPALTDSDYRRLWKQAGDIFWLLRHSFPASFQAVFPEDHQKAEALMRRLRTMVRVADELRRRFCPDLAPSRSSLKPVLKVPLSMRIEWAREKFAAEMAAADAAVEASAQP